MKVTLKELEKLGACEQAKKRFKRMFGEMVLAGPEEARRFFRGKEGWLYWFLSERCPRRYDRVTNVCLKKCKRGLQSNPYPESNYPRWRGYRDTVWREFYSDRREALMKFFR